MRDVVLALFWMAALPMSLASPVAGVCFWIWDALFSPTELAYSFMANVEINKLVALCTMAAMVMSPPQRLRIGRTGALLILLAASSSVSYLTTIYSTGDGGTLLYTKLLKEIVLALVIVALLDRQERLHLAMLAAALGLGFMGVKEGLIAILTAGGHHITGSRATGDNNQLAAALVSTIPFMYVAFRLARSGLVRIGLVVSIGLTVVTVVMTFSRGGFVGLVVLSLLYLKNSRRRLIGILVLFVAAVALWQFAPDSWFHRVDTIDNASQDSSFMGRVIAWKLSWLIAADHPLFGGGMHAVQQWSVWDHYSLSFHSLDFIPTDVPDINPHAAHSIYFEVLGDLGFVGFGLYVLLMATTLLNCRRVRKMAKAGQCRPPLGAMAEAVSWSMTCYMVTGAALSIAYYDLFFVIVGFSAACRLIAVQQVADARDAVSALASVPSGERLQPPTGLRGRPARARGRGIAV